MMLEQLITRYLDGELTEEQDRELREMVRVDPLAREAFESSVLIHIAMRWEDDTSVPRDLRTPVFDAVDALANELPSSMSASGGSSSGRRSSGKFSRGSQLAAGLVAALIMLIMPVSESYLLDSDPGALSYSVPAGRHVGTEEAFSGTIPSDATYTPTIASSHDLSLDLAVAERSDERVLQGASAEQDAVEETAPPLRSFFSYTDAIAEHDASMALAVADRRPSPPTDQEASGLGSEQTESTSISVSTSYAAGLSSTIEGAKNVRQIAASIGYGLSDRDMFGLEVGTTSYSLSTTTTMTTGPGSSASAAAEPSGDRQVPGKLASPEPVTGSYQTYSYAVSRQETSVWGSAFYERKLLNISSVSVTGRAGAGVGADGLLGYGRLVGEWSLGAGLSVVAGAEARAMPFRVGSTDGSTSATTYGTVLTALTGLYLRF